MSKLYIKGYVDGTYKPLPDPGPDKALKFWQREVGGYVEVKYMDDGIVLLFNEDGLPLGLPRNKGIPCLVRDVLVGSYYSKNRSGTITISGFEGARANELFKEFEDKRKQREEADADKGKPHAGISRPSQHVQ